MLPLDAVSFRLFVVLCDVANGIARQREAYPVGGDDWLALTQVMQALDELIDTIVCSDAIEAAESAPED